MSQRVLWLWRGALTAGLLSSTLIGLTHYCIGKSQWWKVLLNGEGWTVYPPLSSLPHAIPGVSTFILGWPVEYVDALTIAALFGLLFTSF